jgi:hypothetical protein
MSDCTLAAMDEINNNDLKISFLVAIGYLETLPFCCAVLGHALVKVIEQLRSI